MPHINGMLISAFLPPTDKKYLAHVERSISSLKYDIFKSCNRMTLVNSLLIPSHNKIAFSSVAQHITLPFSSA